MRKIDFGAGGPFRLRVTERGPPVACGERGPGGGQLFDKGSAVGGKHCCSALWNRTRELWTVVKGVGQGAGRGDRLGLLRCFELADFGPAIGAPGKRPNTEFACALIGTVVKVATEPRL